MNYNFLSEIGVGAVAGSRPEQAVILVMPIPAPPGGAGGNDRVVGALACDATDVGVWSDLARLGSSGTARSATSLTETTTSTF